MALKVFLRHPWYGSDGLYRRAVDNPHIVEADLKDLPSTAEVEITGGKKELVWKLRGEEDPATRAQTAGEEAEARKNVPLAKALMGSKGADNSELLAKIKKLEADNAALTAKLKAAEEEEKEEEKEEAKESEKAPATPPASPTKK